MHLVSFAAPGLAASLRLCTCTKSQQQSAAPLRCTYCEGRDLRVFGKTLVHFAAGDRLYDRAVIVEFEDFLRLSTAASSVAPAATNEVLPVGWATYECEGR